MGTTFRHFKELVDFYSQHRLSKHISNVPENYYINKAVNVAFGKVAASPDLIYDEPY